MYPNMHMYGIGNQRPRTRNPDPEIYPDQSQNQITLLRPQNPYARPQVQHLAKSFVPGFKPQVYQNHFNAPSNRPQGTGFFSALEERYIVRRKPNPKPSDHTHNVIAHSNRGSNIPSSSSGTIPAPLIDFELEDESPNARPVSRVPKRTIWARDYNKSLSHKNPSVQPAQCSIATTATKCSMSASQSTIASGMILNVFNPMVAAKIRAEGFEKAAAAFRTMNHNICPQIEYHSTSVSASPSTNINLNFEKESMQTESPNVQMEHKQPQQPSQACQDEQMKMCQTIQLQQDQPFGNYRSPNPKASFTTQRSDDAESTPCEEDSDEVLDEEFYEETNTKINDTITLDETINYEISICSTTSFSSPETQNSEHNSNCSKLVEMQSSSSNLAQNHEFDTSSNEITETVPTTTETQNRGSDTSSSETIEMPSSSKTETQNSAHQTLPPNIMEMFSFEPDNKQNRNFTLVPEPYDEDYIRCEDRPLGLFVPRKLGTDKEHYMIMPHQCGMSDIKPLNLGTTIDEENVSGFTITTQVENQAASKLRLPDSDICDELSTSFESNPIENCETNEANETYVIW